MTTPDRHRAALEAVCHQVLALSRSPECEVTVSEHEDAHTRFAANQVTTSGCERDVALSIHSRGDGRTGTVTTGDLRPESLALAVRRSEAIWRVAPRDPEYVSSLGPQRYAELPAAWSDETAAATPMERAAVVRAALAAARAKSLRGAGFLETHARYTAIASKAGNFGYHRSAQASFSTTLRTVDGTGSGWAGLDATALSALGADALVQRAVEKALRSANPQSHPPGKQTVILEPQAVGDLVSGVVRAAFDARSIDEGRSYFSKPGGKNKLGERVFADFVTLRTNPADARIPGNPWGEGGLPTTAVTWAEKGVLRALSVGRYWARKSGRQPLSFSGGVLLEGGQGTTAELIARTGEGLLVTRFWYIRMVNPQTLALTGLTRDGVWRIEDGKVTTPVNNFRWNMSPLLALSQVDAMTAPESTGEAVVPAMRIPGFDLTSRSDAV